MALLVREWMGREAGTPAPQQGCRVPGTRPSARGAQQELTVCVQRAGASQGTRSSQAHALQQGQ